MSRQIRKVGFVNLPENRLDIFSSLTRHEDYRAEVVIDFDTSAYSYKLAEILQVPTSTSLALLRRFPCHIVVIPNDRPDLKVELSDYLGEPPAIVLTVDEMAARLELSAPPGTAPERGRSAEWSLPLPLPSRKPLPPSAESRVSDPAPSRTPPETFEGLQIERIPGHDRPPRGVTAPDKAPHAFGGPHRPADWVVVPHESPLRGHRPAPAARPEPVTRAEPATPEEQLTAAVETLNLAVDKQVLLERILQIALTSVGGDAGSIMLLDESGEYLRIAVAYGLSDELIRRTRQRVGEGVAGNVMLEGRGRILIDRLNDPRYKTGRERTLIKAALCVPIKVGAQPIGVLNVSSNARRDAFDPRAQERLERFGVEVASVLVKSREVAPSAERPLEPMLRAQVDNLMSLTGSLNERLQNIAESFGRATGALACRIYLLDGTGRRLLPLGVFGTGSLTAAPPAIPVDAGLIGWVLKHGLPEALISSGTDPDARAVCYIPLGDESRLGLVEFEGLPADAASGSEFEALQQVCAYLTATLEKERSTKVMARRSRQLLHLSDMAVEMMSERSLEDLLDMALASASGLFDADLAAIRLLPDDILAVSDQELVESFDPAARALLDFDDDLGRFTRQRTQPITATQLPAELTEKLAGLGNVRWIVAAPLLGPRGPIGVLTLYGQSAATVGLESDELAVLEKFCGHLGRAIHRAGKAVDELPMEGIMRWSLFQERVIEEILRAERHDRAFTVTVFEIPGLEEAADRYGRIWLGAARGVLNRYITRHVGAADVATRIREGRLAVLSTESPGDDDVLCQTLIAGWPEAAAASGVESLSFMPFDVEYFTFPRDSRNGDEFIDMIADRFGGEMESAAG